MSNEVIATVRHPGFDVVELEFPINWRMDPFHSKSWQHNFMSLRWINPQTLGAQLLPILKSFYHFHCVKKVSNPYYNTLRGDHTATIRLKQLIKFRSFYEGKEDVPGAGLCQRLILQDIANLQLPEMYRKGHNHGLMMDISLLDLYKEDIRYRSKINRELILKRGIETIRTMYTLDGLTREHSVSYQEHNFPLARDFLKHFPTAIDSAALVDNTIGLLSFALRDCGEYFPLGDSFRQPNVTLLEGCPEISGFLEKSKQNGSVGKRVFCGAGMFFYKRVSSDWKKLHFASTCTWHSNNHKQDDELSFCLDIDGTLVFDDSGYTVYKNDLDVQLKNAAAHSTVEIFGIPFGDRRPPAERSIIENWREEDNGFEMVASHTRIPGFCVRRAFRLSRNELSIADVIHASAIEEFTSVHNFILGPSVQPEISGDKVYLRHDSQIVASITVVEAEGSWQLEEQLYIGNNRFQYITTKKLCFVQNRKSQVSFLLQF